MLEKLPDAVGHALINQRAGLDAIVYNRIDLRQGTASIEVSSLAFHDHEKIPEKYTADGAGVSPPVEWRGVPIDAASIVVIVEDADAPTPHPLVHAIATIMQGGDAALQEGALNDPDQTAPGTHLGRNSYLQRGWLPPDPPPGHGPHRYAIQVFALEAAATFTDTPGRDEIVEQIQLYALASGCMIGTYERPDDTAPEPSPQAVLS